MTEIERVQAYRNTLRACVIALWVATTSVPLDADHYGFWPLGLADLLHAVQATALFLWLWRRGARWSARTYDHVFAFLFAPYLVTIWLPQIYDLRAGTLVEPLLAHHFGLLALAILAPASLRWGVGLIALLTAHGIALWAVLAHATESPALAREPWFTVLFAGTALGILWSRSRRAELVHQLAAIEARASATARLNRVVLGLRDRANTPLQTLEVAISVLEKRGGQDDATLSAMRRAVEQLVALQKVLSQAGPAGSLQVRVDLERELRELTDSGR